MAVKDNSPFEPGRFYHLFNRGNNRERIFFSEENRRYFLLKFDQYLSGTLEVFAYCLLSNHFHFLVRVKEGEEGLGDLPGFENLEGLKAEGLKAEGQTAPSYPRPRCPISQALSNFLNAYAKAINKQENRSGSLFQKTCKRVLVDDEAYLVAVIYYIHNNPVHHHLTGRLQDYRWSSYNRILKNDAPKLRKKEVLDIFGGAEEYIAYHEQRRECVGGEDYLVE